MMPNESEADRGFRDVFNGALRDYHTTRASQTYISAHYKESEHWAVIASIAKTCCMIIEAALQANQELAWLIRWKRRLLLIEQKANAKHKLAFDKAVAELTGARPDPVQTVRL